MDIEAGSAQQPELQAQQEQQEQPAQPVAIDETRQVKAKQYARIRRRYSLINMGIAFLGVILLLFAGLIGWLRVALIPWAGSRSWDGSHCECLSSA